MVRPTGVIWAALAYLAAALAAQGAGPFNKVHLRLPRLLEAPKEPLLDDEHFSLRPGISALELLKARGYIAKEHNFITSDGYILSLVRGTNPLYNNGQRGLDSKLPILFVNPATLTSAAYLANSAFVRPRAHDLSAEQLVQLDARRLKELLADEPALTSLPFLALNLGYEVWLLDRRGFTEPRRKIGHERRSLTDAWNSLPTALLGNVLDGFTLDANLKPDRPVRTQTHAQDPQSAYENGTTIHVAAGPAQDGLRELSESGRAKRAKRANSRRNLLTGLVAPTPVNILQLMFLLAKLPGALKRMGDIRNDFIETFDPDFWRFSLDEQAEIDLPQAVDFVLEKTGKQKLHTVSLSCGGAITLMALANKPQLASKISRAVMWAPSINLGSKSDSIYQLGQVMPLIQGYTGPLPYVFAKREVQYWIQKICAFDLLQRTLCEGALDAIGGFSGGQAPLRPSTAAVLFAPTSVVELEHLAQMARTQRPCKYSFNTKEKNLLAYGTVEPPCYDLGAIELRNISFYVGANDLLVSPDDVATSQLQMSVPSELHIIKGEELHFNHFGSIMHQNTDELVIIPSLLDMERSQAAAAAAAASELELDLGESENLI